MSGLILESCPDCGHVWRLARGLCPRCGSRKIETREAAGGGRVYSVTTVTRAPDETFRALVPYRIALVDLDEGPRVMAHLDGEAGIGDRVRGAIETRAEREIPVFRAE
jgi:uncharacterized OB-fold protein